MVLNLDIRIGTTCRLVPESTISIVSSRRISNISYHFGHTAILVSGQNKQYPQYRYFGLIQILSMWPNMIETLLILLILRQDKTIPKKTTADNTNNKISNHVELTHIKYHVCKLVSQNSINYLNDMFNK